MPNFLQLILTITQNHIAEFLAFATSVIFWKTIRKSKFHWLPFFLFFILVVELTGNYLRWVMYANIILYNITIPLEYFFYLFLFWLQGRALLKQFTKFSAIALGTTAIFFYLYQPLTVLHSYVLVTGEVCVIICSCIYLYEQFQNPESESLFKNYFFWLLSGLLLFNLGELSYFLLFPAIKANNWDKFSALFKAINNQLLLLLYLSYIISILVYKKYSSPQNAGKY